MTTSNPSRPGLVFDADSARLLVVRSITGFVVACAHFELSFHAGQLVKLFRVCQNCKHIVRLRRSAGLLPAAPSP
jgi:hypothetical protein